MDRTHATQTAPRAVLDLVVEMGSAPPAELGTPEHLSWVCSQIRRSLEVGGVAVLLVDAGGARRLAASSDPVSAALADPHALGAPARDVGSFDLVDPSGRDLGVLQLFSPSPGADPELARHARSVADVLAAGLVAAGQHRRSAELVAQLSAALADRAPVEQAKGVLAERYQCDVGAAFALLRAQARRHRVTVLDTARTVLAGDAVLDLRVAPARWRGPRAPAVAVPRP